MRRLMFTRKQLEAVKALWLRSQDGERCYRKFRKRFHVSPALGCVMGKWRGLAVGIEDDGYTHS